jgi:pimeloyl-ACP methyl ester carboxylesterase
VPAPVTSVWGEAHAVSSGSSLLSLEPCEDDPAFLCGTLPVDLDRRNRDGRKVNLHVEVFPHQGPAAESEGAVFVTEGGLGFSVSLDAKYGYAFFLLADVAETRDLVFVDQRGVGLSDVIYCPDAQHGGPFYESAATCHDQLGDTADLHSTTDVADDLNDVRKALGYGRIDVVGGSYAGTDMLTFAARHKRHVRSAILGAPAVTVDTDPFNSYPPIAFPDVVNGVCGRSPACAQANPDPNGSLAWLAARLRRRPVTGVGIDSEGTPRQITVTENLLANAIMFHTGPSFVGPGEITQAAAALRRGDRTPLLRLAADVDPANGFDAGDPREFSSGHALARICVDLPVQWDKGADAETRFAQYDAAFAAEPDFYGPISKGAWAHPGYLGFQPLPCIVSTWEDRPNYPSGRQVRGVPALVLAGEYDVGLPASLARLATDVLVDAEYVDMAAAGHVPWWYSDCGPELVQRFIETLTAGDTSCADEPAGGWWMPGSFPTKVQKAPPADQVSGPPASTKIRRFATVVAWTVMDGIQHNYSV